MDMSEILNQCNEVIDSQSGEHISLVLPGKWGKTNDRRLCKGGPVGQIVSDNFRGSGIVVLFNAKEVKEYVTNQSLDSGGKKTPQVS